MKRIPLNKADYYETFPAYLDGISRKFGEKPAITYFTRKQEAVTASYAQLTRQALAQPMRCRRGDTPESIWPSWRKTATIGW